MDGRTARGYATDINASLIVANFSAYTCASNNAQNACLGKRRPRYKQYNAIMMYSSDGIHATTKNVVHVSYDKNVRGDDVVDRTRPKVCSAVFSTRGKGSESAASGVRFRGKFHRD